MHTVKNGFGKEKCPHRFAGQKFETVFVRGREAFVKGWLYCIDCGERLGPDSTNRSIYDHWKFRFYKKFYDEMK